MHLLTHKIKNAWQRGKVVLVLFLDIEGAFPNADIDQLLHNMCLCHVPEPYVLFIDRMIRGRKTRLKFDDYMSDTFDILTGIGQGNPLSMLLYLFYNADLLDILSSRNEAALGYVDDTMFFAEGDNLDDTNAMIVDMMTRADGGYQWAADHHSKFETSKFALMGFTRRREECEFGHGTVPLHRPSIQLNGILIEPSKSCRFLGVTFDQELCWSEQAKSALGKATKWTLMYQRLAKQSTGTGSKFMRQLYLAVAVPKLTYMVDVWYTPIHLEEGHIRHSSSVSIAKQLA
jgi:Reverse transcriptase (RNA-dependent DNA polymerase)